MIKVEYHTEKMRKHNIIEPPTNNPLRKLAHAIYRDYFSYKKIKNFNRKFLIFFLIFAQNIDCRTAEAVLTTGARRLDSFFFFFFFFFCIFTRLETLTICSCNYFTFKTFSINPQSSLVYGLLYRQGRKRGVLV